MGIMRFNPARPTRAAASPPPRLAVVCALAVAWVWAALAAALPGTAWAQERVTPLDGPAFDAALSAISAEGALAGQNIPNGLALALVRRVERGAANPLPGGELLLELVGGGRLPLARVAFADERFRFDGFFREEASLSIDAVRALRFASSVKVDSFEEALAKPAADFDRVFVRVEDGVQSVNGLLTEITADSVSFEWQNRAHALPRSKVHGVVLASPELEGARRGARVELAGGAALVGEIVSLAEGKLLLRLPGKSELAAPWPSVTRVEVNSPRLAFLSDLTPVAVEERVLLTPPRPWRRDQSVGGRPLALRKTVFERGIGVHAQSKLVFALDGAYDAFAAALGVDDETDGVGDCVFEVLADDRVLLQKRLRGNDPAEHVRLDVRGVKRLTLQVLPGEDLDFGDHANWADARLLRLGR